MITTKDGSFITYLVILSRKTAKAENKQNKLQVVATLISPQPNDYLRTVEHFQIIVCQEMDYETW